MITDSVRDLSLEDDDSYANVQGRASPKRLKTHPVVKKKVKGIKTVSTNVYDREGNDVSNIATSSVDIVNRVMQQDLLNVQKNSSGVLKTSVGERIISSAMNEVLRDPRISGDITNNFKLCMKKIVDAERLKKEFTIHCALSKDQLCSLTKLFCEYRLVVGDITDSNGHYASRIARKISEYYIEDKLLDISKYSSVGPHRFLGKDIGANAQRYVGRGDRRWHCCMPDPILTGFTDARRRAKSDQFLTTISVNDDDNVKFLRDELMKRNSSYYCNNLSQNCDVPANALKLLFVHDISFEDIGLSMIRSGAQVAGGCIMFNPLVIIQNEGILPDMQVKFQKYREHGVKKIRFSFIGDTQDSYVHDYGEYIKFLKANYITIKYNGVRYGFIFERERYGFDTLFYRVYPAKAFKDTTVYNELPFISDNMYYVVYGYMYNLLPKCAHLRDIREENMMEPFAFRVKRAVFDHSLMQSVNMIKDFTSQSVLKLVALHNGRELSNGQSMLYNNDSERLPSDQVAKLALVVFLMAHRIRYEYSKSTTILTGDMERLKLKINRPWWWRAISSVFSNNTKDVERFKEDIQMTASNLGGTELQLDDVRVRSDSFFTRIGNAIKDKVSSVFPNYVASMKYDFGSIDFVSAVTMEEYVRMSCDITPMKLHNMNEEEVELLPVTFFNDPNILPAGVTEGLLTSEEFTPVKCVSELELLETPGDGDCFYHALILSGLPCKTVASLRKKLHASKHLAKLRDYEDIRAAIANGGMGEAALLHVVAIEYNVSICLHEGSNCRLYGVSSARIHIHFQNAHYSALVYKDATVTPVVVNNPVVTDHVELADSDVYTAEFFDLETQLSHYNFCTVATVPKPHVLSEIEILCKILFKIDRIMNIFDPLGTCINMFNELGRFVPVCLYSCVSNKGDRCKLSNLITGSNDLGQIEENLTEIVYSVVTSNNLFDVLVFFMEKKISFHTKLSTHFSDPQLGSDVLEGVLMTLKDRGTLVLRIASSNSYNFNLLAKLHRYFSSVNMRVSELSNATDGAIYFEFSGFKREMYIIAHINGKSFSAYEEYSDVHNSYVSMIKAHNESLNTRAKRILVKLNRLKESRRHLSTFLEIENARYNDDVNKYFTLPNPLSGSGSTIDIEPAVKFEPLPVVIRNMRFVICDNCYDSNSMFSSRVVNRAVADDLNIPIDHRMACDSCEMSSASSVDDIDVASVYESVATTSAIGCDAVSLCDSRGSSLLCELSVNAAVDEAIELQPRDANDTFPPSKCIKTTKLRKLIKAAKSHKLNRVCHKLRFKGLDSKVYDHKFVGPSLFEKYRDMTIEYVNDPDLPRRGKLGRLFNNPLRRLIHGGFVPYGNVVDKTNLSPYNDTFSEFRSRPKRILIHAKDESDSDSSCDSEEEDEEAPPDSPIPEKTLADLRCAAEELKRYITKEVELLKGQCREKFRIYRTLTHRNNDVYVSNNELDYIIIKGERVLLKDKYTDVLDYTHVYVENTHDIVSCDEYHAGFGTRYDLAMAVKEFCPFLNYRILETMSKHKLNFSSLKTLRFFQAVPGGGKTTRMIKDHKKYSDVCVVQTKEGRDSLLNRVKDVRKEDKQLRYRTSASILVNGFCDSRKPVSVHSVYYDEALQQHAGYAAYIISLTKCKEFIAFGDCKQIHFESRVEGFECKYKDLDNILVSTDFLYTTFRIPSRQLSIVAPFYKTVLGGNVMTSMNNTVPLLQLDDYNHNNLINSMRKDGSIALLTFSQSDKSYLASVVKTYEALLPVFAGPFTLGEYQGQEADHVVVVRAQNVNPSFVLYNDENQIVTALTRNKRTLTYLTVCRSDKMSQLITSYNRMRGGGSSDGVGNTVGVTPNYKHIIPCFKVKQGNITRVRGAFKLNISKTYLYRGVDANIKITTLHNTIDRIKSELSALNSSHISRIYISDDLFVSFDWKALSSILPKLFDGFDVTIVSPKRFSNVLIPELELAFGEFNEDYESCNVTESIETCDDAALAITYDSGGVELLQYTYDVLFPMSTGRDYVSERYEVHAQAINLEFGELPVSIVPWDFVVDLPTTVYMKPKLSTHIGLRRLNTLHEQLLGLYKRNANAPKCFIAIDYELQTGELISNLENLMIDKDYSVTVTNADVSDWIDRKGLALYKNLRKELDEAHIDFTYWTMMIKSDVKPVLTDTAWSQYSAVQTIVYNNKKLYNALFAPFLCKLKGRLKACLDPNKVFIMSDGSLTELESELNMRHERMTGDVLEMDMGKFDKSQGLTALLFDVELFTRAGMPQWMIKLWFLSHLIAPIGGFQTSLKTILPHQRRSGDPWTYGGNTFFLTSILATVCDDFNFMMVSGDDSLVYGEFPMHTRKELCDRIAREFFFDVKLCTYRSKYFCSKFLIEINGTYRFVPDPVKLLIKFGRNDIRDYGHLEEYRISMVDQIDVYKYFDVRVIMNELIVDRYPRLYNAADLMSTLYSFVIDPAQFQTLFNFSEDSLYKAVLVPKDCDLSRFDSPHVFIHDNLIKRSVANMSPEQLSEYYREVGVGVKGLLFTYDLSYVPRGFSVVCNTLELDEVSREGLLNSIVKQLIN